jgi:hypothetical protein
VGTPFAQHCHVSPKQIRASVQEQVNIVEIDLHDFPAVLLCDNCSSHINDETMQLRAPNNTKLFTFPPHTSNMFQPLNAVTFRVVKREKRGIQVKIPAGSQLLCIRRLMKAYQRTTDSTMDRSALKRAGPAVNPSVSPAVTVANRGNNRKNQRIVTPE